MGFSILVNAAARISSGKMIGGEKIVSDVAGHGGREAAEPGDLMTGEELAKSMRRRQARRQAGPVERGRTGRVRRRFDFSGAAELAESDIHRQPVHAG